KRGHALAPIGIDRSHLGTRLDYGTHLLGDVTELAGVGPHHTERHGKGRIRTEHQLSNPHSSLWRQTVGQRVSQSEFERFARLFALRQCYDLRERRIG